MILSKKRKTAKFNTKNLITYFDADSLVSEQFRAIRTNINFLTEKKQKRAFLVTSPGKSEGKTITAANLAVSMAYQKEKVILIDANLRDPSIHHFFKVPNDTGLSDLLTDKANLNLNKVVHQTGIGNLHILTGGITSSNPAELLGNDSMKELLKEIMEKYDIVLIDSPTVLDSTETLVLANQCDGVVLVLRRGRTTLEKAEEAARLLEIAHASVVGSIINEK